MPKSVEMSVRTFIVPSGKAAGKCPNYESCFETIRMPCIICCASRGPGSSVGNDSGASESRARGEREASGLVLDLDSSRLSLEINLEILKYNIEMLKFV